MPLRLSSGRQIRPTGLRVGAAGSNTLPVPRFAQEQTLWCWAACCSMVFTYRGAPQTQCNIANFGLGLGNCCGSPLPASCNNTLWTYHPTQRDIVDVYHHFGRTASHRFGTISYTGLRSEIDASRPVEVCYSWSGGGAHVAIVRGYREDPNGSQFVFVNDPAYTHGLISFASLNSAYGLGSWVETFMGIT